MVSTLDLRVLPTELRLLLFGYCLKEEWKGSTPALIIALRGDPQLYHEALGIFYASNTLNLSPSTEERMASMSCTALRSIQKVEVSYGLKLRNELFWSLEFFPSRFSSALWKFSNLRSLILLSEFRMGFTNEVEKFLLIFIRGCIVHFTHLRHLGLYIPKSPDPSRLVARISRVTGLQGQTIGDSRRSLDYWEWTELQGKTFLWTDHLYTQNVPWKCVGIVYQHLTNRHRHAFWRTYGTTFPGLMCRRLTSSCYDSCSCTKLSPPLFKCTHSHHDLTFTCGVASNGLDSFGQYSFEVVERRL